MWVLWVLCQHQDPLSVSGSVQSLTQAAVVMEISQEFGTLLPVVTAGGARTPGGDVGGVVVQVVGSDGAA